jgi:hypothetical protein
MKRDNRIKILHKLAKKEQDPLKGQQSRKGIEKHLAKSKQIYDKTTSELASVNSQIAKLQAEKELLEAQQKSARTDVGYCHKLIQTMDFSRSNGVRVGSDREDVAYNVDGQWCSYNDDEGVVAYKKPSKPAEPEKPSEPAVDAEDDDGDFDFLSEGIDITI